MIPYDTVSLLTTTEWLLDLGRTGHNDSWTRSPPMTDLFTFDPIYSVTGTVTSSSGTVLAGANITDPVYTWTTSRSAGTFTLSPANGTYNVTGTAAGYFPDEQTLTVNGASISNFDLVLAPNPIYFTKYAITGTVETSSSVPIGKATIDWIQNGSLMTSSTSSKGQFTAQIPNGTYFLQANAKGYEPALIALVVSGAAESVATFKLATLSPTTNFRVTGRTDYSNGTSLAGATVSTFNQTGVTQMVSNPNGYLLEWLPNGEYVWTMQRSGLIWEVMTGTVDNGWLENPALLRDGRAPFGHGHDRILLGVPRDLRHGELHRGGGDRIDLDREPRSGHVLCSRRGDLRVHRGRSRVHLLDQARDGLGVEPQPRRSEADGLRVASSLGRSRAGAPSVNQLGRSGSRGDGGRS